MDNKLLRHDLLHSNENLVTPRCCEDAGTNPEKERAISWSKWLNNLGNEGMT